MTPRLIIPVQMMVLNGLQPLVYGPLLRLPRVRPPRPTPLHNKRVVRPPVIRPIGTLMTAPALWLTRPMPVITPGRMPVVLVTIVIPPLPLILQLTLTPLQQIHRHPIPTPIRLRMGLPPPIITPRFRVRVPICARIIVRPLIQHGLGQPWIVHDPWPGKLRGRPP